VGNFAASVAILLITLGSERPRSNATRVAFVRRLKRSRSYRRTYAGFRRRLADATEVQGELSTLASRSICIDGWQDAYAQSARREVMS
jgi:hypothetical protein